MICIYIQTIPTGKKAQIPYRLTLKKDESLGIMTFNFRPEVSISKKTYERHQLDRSEVLSAPPFCDIADELIDIFQNAQLVFSELNQFQLLKSQFKTIGYNFNTHPKYLFYQVDKNNHNPMGAFLTSSQNLCEQGIDYAKDFVELMYQYCNTPTDVLNPLKPPAQVRNTLDLSGYKMAPGVYYFLDAHENVIYVGKAKNIRKRLQSHFSKQASSNAIDYSKIKSITVDYSGNDILAQLIESANIKTLKPAYNTQQVEDPAPYIINKGKTAQGILKLQITRKDIRDNMPERYFNRVSVRQSLEEFCATYGLCRKHCGLEKVKGPCSNVTLKNQDCVCADKTIISSYNENFEMAFNHFKNRKSRKIYKLKGRHADEDAFIYMVNGIYEGYGYIDKTETISTINDILGHLIRQNNNYDTSRILSGLDKNIPVENILTLRAQ